MAKKGYQADSGMFPGSMHSSFENEGREGSHSRKRGRRGKRGKKRGGRHGSRRR